MNILFQTASRALLMATIASFAAAALLAGLTNVLDLTGGSAGTSWWVAARAVERGRWVVLALLLMVIAQRAGSASPETGGDNAAVWRLVGRAVIIAPLLWMAATWIVQAILFTLADRWDIDGGMFLAPDYYRQLFIGYVPWLLGGAATIAASRHVR